ncbi:MAG: cyclodeaminase/cyclohydrolase family protein [Candidatus Thorarchaeota archaeon]
MLYDMSLKEFLKETASDRAAPGGGSVAALTGALASSLGAMVCNLTLGKEKYIAVQDEIKDLLHNLTANLETLTKLIEDDANAFNDVMDAFKMPKETEQQIEERKKAIQSGYKKAISVPNETAKVTMNTLELLEPILEKGNQNAITDAATGALVAVAAIRGAILNIKINLTSINDEIYINTIKKEILELEQKAMVTANRILDKTNKLIG